LRLFRYVRITNSCGAVHFNSANSGFVQAMAIASTNNAEIPMPEQQARDNARRPAWQRAQPAAVDLTARG